MKSLIEVDKKIVTDYDDIGKDMKLQPYDYQKEMSTAYKKWWKNLSNLSS